jgi:predicted Zn-dependent peptidase
MKKPSRRGAVIRTFVASLAALCLVPPAVAGQGKLYEPPDPTAPRTAPRPRPAPSTTKPGPAPARRPTRVEPAPPVAMPAKPLTPAVLDITATSIPNGLEVVLLEDHSAPIVSVQVWYHVGSKDEQPGRTGFAHMFEHLMFRGSSNVRPQEHAQRIQDAGGVLNAGTNFDYTFYWETIPSNALDLALWLEADRMASLDIDEEDFKAERDVVLGERRQTVEAAPYGRLSETIFSTVYKTHSYRWMPIGSREDLLAATLAEVQAFHDTYYVPNNATLVLVGDFQTDDALSKVLAYFGQIPRARKAIPRPARPEPEQTDERRVTVYDANAALPVTISAYRIPGLGHPDTYPLQVAQLILSGGRSGRLYQRMVYKKQIATQVAGGSMLLEDSGLFFFYALMTREAGVEVGEAEFDEEVERLREELVSAAELEKARNQLISGIIIDRESVFEKATAIGYAAAMLKEPKLINEELARFQAVTAEDIQRVARKYFTVQNRSAIHMLPEDMRPADGSGVPGGGTR